ncbi:MAG: succinyldiaminopimelate transaminase [Corynebacterium sp.]|nr:succinyldiaminopimelate transaminase [Corynebacterium sp.]
MVRQPLGSRLPDFPWNSLAPYQQKAQEHPEGRINLSVGSPVDEVAPSIQLALAEAAAAPGYPQTIGTPELRAAITASLQRRYGISHPGGVLPVVGTKEAIAMLPSHLGIQGTVIIPEVAYPTYEVSGLVAHADVVRSDAPWELDAATTAAAGLIFINSPGNPTGSVASVEYLRRVIDWGREHDVIVVCDECYLGLIWEGEAYSLLHPKVAGDDLSNLLIIHSLSKTSNLASYRAGFIAGDEKLLAELTEVRKHCGLMLPGPIQAAMAAGCADDDQETLQRLRYARRRKVLLEAVINAGFEVTDSQAGLYLWMSRGEDCWQTVEWFAERGIVVAPGSFYSPNTHNYVRLALTATDADIVAASRRIAQ